MANDDHLRIVLQGAKAIAGWRETHPNEGLDLREANLRRANLVHADLTQADFSAANLEWADLRWSDLIGASFDTAKLVRADLFKTELARTSLRRADLRMANLEDANLRGAELSGAIFGHTRLFSTDFGGTLGLADSVHVSSSFIDDESIVKSGTLPDEFLRGCGLRDRDIFAAELQDASVPESRAAWLRAELARHQESEEEYYSAFISYSHVDQTFAGSLHATLQNQGVRCWLDEHQLLPGDDIYDQVDRGIRLWDKVLLCCSEASLTSWWVDNEIDIAFEKERRLMAERRRKVLALMPLNLDGFLFSDGWHSGKKQQLKSRLAADFRGWDTDSAQFQKAVERVIQALRVNREQIRDGPPTPRL